MQIILDVSKKKTVYNVRHVLTNTKLRMQGGVFGLLAVNLIATELLASSHLLTSMSTKDKPNSFQ